MAALELPNSGVGMITVWGMVSAPAGSAVSRVGVIVVDLQGDFTTFKNGALAAPGSDQAFVDHVRQATRDLHARGHLIFATQDWHPAEHVSFFTNHKDKKPFETIRIADRGQVLWPPHCVQGTANARILVDNNLFQAVVKKGQDPSYDSYSGFQDDGGAKTEMDAILKRNGISELIVYGLATDYCVKATALDALAAGYTVTVVESLCRGVARDTAAIALKEMKTKGIRVVDRLQTLTEQG